MIVLTRVSLGVQHVQDTSGTCQMIIPQDPFFWKRGTIGPQATPIPERHKQTQKPYDKKSESIDSQVLYGSISYIIYIIWSAYRWKGLHVRFLLTRTRTLLYIHFTAALGPSCHKATADATWLSGSMCQALTWTNEQAEILQYAATSIKSMMCFCCTWQANPWKEATAFSKKTWTLRAEWCSLKITNFPIETINGNMFWMGLPNYPLTSLPFERFNASSCLVASTGFTFKNMIPGSRNSNKKRLQRTIIERFCFWKPTFVWLHVWLQINTTLGGRVAGFGRQPCQLRRPPLPFLGSIGRRVWRPVATAARGLGQGKTLCCLGESLYIQSWHLEVPRYSTTLGDRWW